MSLPLCHLPHDVLECILQASIAPHGWSFDRDWPSVSIITTIARFCASCKLLRSLSTCVKASDGTSLLKYHGVRTWEQLAVAVAVRACREDDGGNRIGFEFASPSIASDDGQGSDVMLSLQRCAAFGEIASRHPRARVVIESHCGPTAPQGISTSYSMRRADAIVQELQKVGCGNRQRILTVPYGKRVSTSEAIYMSTHPNSKSAKRGFGWAEIRIVLDGLEFPQPPDYILAARQQMCCGQRSNLEQGGDSSSVDTDEMEMISSRMTGRRCIIC